MRIETGINGLNGVLETVRASIEFLPSLSFVIFRVGYLCFPDRENASTITMMRRSLPTITILAVIASPCRAGEPAALPALTTVAEIRAQDGLAYNSDRPLSLTGIVTLVDASRNMLVLQDATGAVALHPDSSGIPVQAGQRVSLNASAWAPFVASLPGFPYQPSGRDVRDRFEVPENEGNHRLTRMRGWLQPPVTGKYTFWIASDDSSELWLSTDSNPALARKIAFVPTSGWTDPHEWSRFPSQRSETLVLQAGESYFIEALQDQQLETSHLAVAWEGPEMKQDVIDGRFVVPWRVEGGVPPTSPDSSPAHGILREIWTDYAVGYLEPFKTGKVAEGGLTVRGMRISRLGDGVWPDPQPFEPGRQLASEDIHRWVEGEGSVRFLATDGTSATLELAVNGHRVLACVVRWQGSLPPPGPHLRARFRGVWEGVKDATEHLKTGFISVPSQLDVSFFEGQGEPQQGPASPLQDPVAAGPGGYFFTRGVVTFNDRVRGKDCIFIQDARNGIFVSQEERQLRTQLQVGQAIQIGGPLLPGKFAPGISPATFNVLGWQNLPIPAIPSAESPAESYRDGQWTEMEGVARAVNPDGTVLVMGRRVPLLVWIGQSDRDRLESLVNSTLRIRGVLSLELFGSPALLVPSRGFVEVLESAPELPEKPHPVAALNVSGLQEGWPHQVKVAGIVTYRDDRGFYLQDEGGGVLVESRNETLPRIGESVQVLGFPAVGKLTEAVWLPSDSTGSVVPAVWDPNRPGPSRNGMLTTVEALLVSSKTIGADQVLELQSDQHVFEAVLGNPSNKMRRFAAGSVLAVTGVGILESTPSSVPHQDPAMVLTRLLLRSPEDAVLLQGPPWWTWQRTATAIGLLLAVLAASLWRIESMNRRFARQEASRMAFARGMLASQEGERRRIAASLHDSLGQDLLVIRNQTHLAIQSSAEKSDLRQRLEEISNTTLQAINEVREITHNLRPYQLDRLGLTQSIRAITRKVSESHPVSFACHVDEIDGVFDNDSEIHVYRIVQEGINNILKHSAATEATVVIKKASGNLSISIRDNGRGLADGGVTADSGFGLSGIRERAEIMGGTARIDSSPGQGVNLHVLLPLQPTTK